MMIEGICPCCGKKIINCYDYKKNKFNCISKEAEVAYFYYCFDCKKYFIKIQSYELVPTRASYYVE